MQSKSLLTGSQNWTFCKTEPRRNSCCLVLGGLSFLMALDVGPLISNHFRFLTLLDHGGLEVHDVGDGSDRLNIFSGHKSVNPWLAAYSKKDLDPIMSTGTTLLPGMVITIEPGMYVDILHH